MKTFAAILLFLFLFFQGTAQEIPAVREASEDFIIKRIEIVPSLTILAPEIPNTGNYRIREVDFNTQDDRQEVNIAEYIAMENRMKKARMIELAPPIQLPKEDKGISLNRDTDFSAHPRFFNQSFSPDLPTTGTRNSVYRNAAEGTGHYYLSRYNPFSRGYGYRY